jgi:hypothetical protein
MLNDTRNAITNPGLAGAILLVAFICVMGVGLVAWGFLLP